MKIIKRRILPVLLAVAMVLTGQTLDFGGNRADAADSDVIISGIKVFHPWYREEEILDDQGNPTGNTQYVLDTAEYSGTELEDSSVLTRQITKNDTDYTLYIDAGDTVQITINDQSGESGKCSAQLLNSDRTEYTGSVISCNSLNYAHTVYDITASNNTDLNTVFLRVFNGVEMLDIEIKKMIPIHNCISNSESVNFAGELTMNGLNTMTGISKTEYSVGLVANTFDPDKREYVSVDSSINLNTTDIIKWSMTGLDEKSSVSPENTIGTSAILDVSDTSGVAVLTAQITSGITGTNVIDCVRKRALKGSKSVNVAKFTKATSLKFSDDTYNIKQGSTFALKDLLTRTPSDSDDTLKWTTEKSSIASIDSGSGQITAVGLGETIITATSVENPDVTGTCKVFVYKETASLTTYCNDVKTTSRNIRVGNTITVNVKEDNGATEPLVAKVTTDEGDVADVSIKNVGQQDDNSTNFEITVNNYNNSSVSIPKYSILFSTDRNDSENQTTTSFGLSVYPALDGNISIYKKGESETEIGDTLTLWTSDKNNPTTLRAYVKDVSGTEPGDQIAWDFKNVNDCYEIDNYPDGDTTAVKITPVSKCVDTELTATAKSNSENTDTIKINVNQSTQKVTLCDDSENKQSVSDVTFAIGSTVRVTALQETGTGVPSDETVSFSSSNDKIATVTEDVDGYYVVKGVGEGEATITAKSSYTGKTATMRVKVLTIGSVTIASSISFGESYILSAETPLTSKYNTTATIYARVTDSASNKVDNPSIEWVVNNENVAKVIRSSRTANYAEATIQFNKVGTTTIKAKFGDKVYNSFTVRTTSPLADKYVTVDGIKEYDEFTYRPNGKLPTIVPVVTGSNDSREAKYVLTAEDEYTTSTSYRDSSVDAETGTVTKGSGVGSYNYTITGVSDGLYTGYTVISPYSVVSKAISDDSVKPNSGITITVDDSNLIYNGVAQLPEVNVVYTDPEDPTNVETLVLGNDFTITGDNNVDAGTAELTVTGKGNFSGTYNTTFEIKQYDMSLEDNISFAAIADQIYTGFKIKPVATAYRGKIQSSATVLTLEKDYTVTYSNNKNVGTATVKLEAVKDAEGKYTGNYKNSTETTFTIKPLAITNGQIATEKIDDITYTTEEIKPGVSMTFNTIGAEPKKIEDLVEGKDYTLTYKDNINAGIATITVTGIGNYTDSKAVTFKILPKNVDEEEVVLDEVINQVYAFTEIKPGITGRYFNDELVDKTDYTLSYSNNVNVGTATITVKGVGNYTGTTDIDFNIVPFSIRSVIINDLADETFIDNEITPDIAASFVDENLKGLESLKKDKDYKLSYANNINAGTATITITGLGNYGETTTKTFKIVPANVSEVVLSAEAQTYTSKKITPDVGFKYVASKAAVYKLGKDYELSYENNKNAGTATITVKGKGNFTGEKTVDFTILPRSLAEEDVMFEDVDDQVYEVSEIKPDVEGSYADDVLEYDKDYTLGYVNNVNVGTALINVAGKGNYTGSRIVEFNIIPCSIEEVVISDVADATFVDNAITPNIAAAYVDEELKINKALVKDADYTLSYENNINAGTATITVTGIGNYDETTSVTFKINPANLSAILLSAEAQTYTGKEITPDVGFVYSASRAAVYELGKDYKLSYENNKDIGTATITVTGKGNFTGDKNTTFNINKSALDLEWVGEIEDQYYAATNLTPELNISNGFIKLEEGTDYVASYSNNYNVNKTYDEKNEEILGTPSKVAITGIGGFAGTVQTEFYIVNKKVKNPAARIIVKDDSDKEIEDETIYTNVGETFNYYLSVPDKSDDVVMVSSEARNEFSALTADVTDGTSATLLITGKVLGEYTLRVYTSSGVYRDLKVVVNVPATKVNILNSKGNDVTEKGWELNSAEEALTTSLTPANSNDIVEWSVDDETIAKIDETGLLTTCGTGTVTVTAKTYVNGSKVPNQTTFTRITVTGIIAVEKIDITADSDVIEINESKELPFQVFPETANEQLNWTSSDDSVVTVNNGTVKGIKSGEATITCSTVDGVVKDTCKITVAETGKQKYTLTVEDGEGSGDYWPEEDVAIKADESDSNYTFTKWQVTGDAKVKDEYAAETNVTMGNGASTIKATYELTEIGKKNAEIEELKAEIEELQSTGESKKTIEELNKVKKELEDAKEKINELENTDAQQEIALAEQKLEDAIKATQEANSKLAEAQTALSDATANSEELTKALAEAKTAKDAADAAKAKAEEAKTTAEATLATLKSEKETAESAKTTAETENAKLKKELEAAKTASSNTSTTNNNANSSNNNTTTTTTTDGSSTAVAEQPITINLDNKNTFSLSYKVRIISTKGIATVKIGKKLVKRNGKATFNFALKKYRRFLRIRRFNRITVTDVEGNTKEVVIRVVR